MQKDGVNICYDSLMLTAIIFILVIGVLVLVHEFGHFLFAKRAGMKVEEFGFGFPPRLVGWKKDETTYSINWIPFGGFVKIMGEDGDIRGPRSFTSASYGHRFLVLIAGVGMNLLFAAVLLMVLNFSGMRIGLQTGEESRAEDIKVQIVSVSEGSPAAAAGLEPLDAIEDYHSLDDFQTTVRDNLDRPMVLKILRGGQTSMKTITPRSDPPEGQGALGISLVLTGVVAYPWYEAVWRGVADAYSLTVNTAIGYYQLLKTLIINGTLIAEVSGPVGIASLTGQAARVGFNFLLQFVAIISVNLAVLNIIPFPALDGGRVLLLGIEKAKGSPVPKKVEGLLNMLGFYLLVLLMVYVTYKDISKFFMK